MAENYFDVMQNAGGETLAGGFPITVSGGVEKGDAVIEGENLWFLTGNQRKQPYENRMPSENRMGAILKCARIRHNCIEAAMNSGDVVYWDDTLGVMTNVAASGLYKCGFVREDAPKPSGQLWVEMRFDGEGVA